MKIEEKADTSDNGTGELTRESSLLAKLNQFFLPPFDIQKGLTRLEGTGDPAEVSLESKSQFRARALNDSGYTFTTEIEVRMLEEIRPDEFFVRGHRLININGKQKKIFISGVIRQRDIASDNTIASVKLADSTVEIEGEVGKQDLQPGFFSRWFNKIF